MLLAVTLSNEAGIVFKGTPAFNCHPPPILVMEFVYVVSFLFVAE